MNLTQMKEQAGTLTSRKLVRKILENSTDTYIYLISDLMYQKYLEDPRFLCFYGHFCFEKLQFLHIW